MLNIERFIYFNADDTFKSRRMYFRNFYKTIARLIESKQLMIQHNDAGDITGICGWFRFKEEDFWKINKIRWSFPEDWNGEKIHIVFCIVNGGSIYDFRKELRSGQGDVEEATWFNMKTKKYVRIKNILKES